MTNDMRPNASPRLRSVATSVPAYRASQGAFVEAAGLAGLGSGLLLLRLAAGRIAYRNAAIGCFVVTAASILAVIIRDRL